MNNENLTNTEVVSMADVATPDLVSELRNAENTFYCSITDDGSRKSRVAIYNAVNNCDVPLKDMVNVVLEVVNVAAYPVEVVSKETGEIINALRTILVTKDGKSYFATSIGVMHSLQRIFAIVGSPEGGAWEKEPVKMKVLRKKTNSDGENYVTTIELV